ncbi:MAG: DUF2946 family protein [Usitatibacter sp.]
MKSRRHLIAIFTALSVGWTALWPLVSQAHLLGGSSEAMPFCHEEAGTQVAPDMAPKEGKQHCPLCVMAFLAAFTPPVVPPSPTQLESVATLAAYWAPLPFGIAVRLPPSRAPPSFPSLQS